MSEQEDIQTTVSKYIKSGNNTPVERCTIPANLIQQLLDQLTEAKSERDAWRQVIAVLCRDGGHYHTENGTEKTKKYVLDQHYELIEKLEKIQKEQEKND